MKSQERTDLVTVFGGSAGGMPARNGLRELRGDWDAAKGDWEKMDPKKLAELDAMWLAASVGRFLTMNDFGLVNGGYDMGTMGMSARSAIVFGERYHKDPAVIGVPAQGYFPGDPHIGKEVLWSDNLAERNGGLMNNSAAFIVLPGAHGTLQEVVSVVEAEANRDESKELHYYTFPERPIIVADLTGNWSEVMLDIYGRWGMGGFIDGKERNVLDRIYIFDAGCFEMNRTNPLMATARLSERGEKQMLAILSRYLRHDETAVVMIQVPTLRQYIGRRLRF